MNHVCTVIIFSVLFITGCGNSRRVKPKEVIVFHAGSLSIPLKQAAQEYELKNPGTKILLESAGSLVCARKITELKKPCDIIASADNFVINQLLIPGYTGWSIKFATNEIVIAFGEKSKYSGEINPDNWMDILRRSDVIYARSDPDSDPCGYRTIFTFKLAAKYYNKPGLAEMMISKNTEYIRPKEVDLVALLESNSIDYMFQYKSVAIQHGFKYIELPKEINLSDPAENDVYKTVNTEITGSKPGIRIKVTGDYINYSISILDNAPQKEAAMDFLLFLLGTDGMSIFRINGQSPLIPLCSDQPGALPSKLQKLLKVIK